MSEHYDRVADLDHTNPTDRYGTTVAHPAQPWTPTVHAFLRHLAAEGFDAAPRVVGSGFDDAGDEVLTWLPGTIFADTVWPNPELSLHGTMLRRLHKAGRSFTPPPDARWMPWTLHTGSSDADIVISHGNIAPWHVVFGESGRPVGLIGWEYGLPRPARAGLVDRILRFVITDNGWYARSQGFTRESRDTEGLWTLAWQSRAALWTLEHRDLLTRTAMR